MAMAVITGFQYPKKIMDLFFLTKGKSATELFLEQHRHNQGPLILIPHIGKFNDRQGYDDVMVFNGPYIQGATPYINSTLNIINEDSLKIVKSDAYIVNIGRGSCVVEAVVSAALEDNRLAGYAADVFEFEDRPKMQLIRPER